MKYTLIIDEEKDEELVLRVKERSEIVDEIEQLLKERESMILGYRGEETLRIQPNDADCFFTDGGRVYLYLGKEKYLTKVRLCQIEELLGANFIKINQGCIINVKRTEKFKSTIGGSLAVILKNGFTDCVARRELKNVKRRFGL